jgi:hypothetical protein
MRYTDKVKLPSKYTREFFKCSMCKIKPEDWGRVKIRDPHLEGRVEGGSVCLIFSCSFAWRALHNVKIKG